MNRAFSVILFTTLSGTGFGLWFWLALRIAWGDSPEERFEDLGWWFGLLLGAVLVATGVIASLWHLGKPARVWRAFSQWRSSWMSREGVFAIAAFATAIAMHFILGWDLESLPELSLLRLAGVLLAIFSAAAVYSTAMIYASLKPVPAWQHPLVVPAYLLFAALGGGILFKGFAAGSDIHESEWVSPCIIAIAMVLWLVKRRYWRDLDRTDLPQTRGDAIGLPGREVSTFEPPHTESNYLTHEMGFVLARKHANKLRHVAIVLFAVLPVLCVSAIWRLQPHDAPDALFNALLWVAAVSFLLGAMVERWLFFAEAKHLVTLYY